MKTISFILSLFFVVTIADIVSGQCTLEADFSYSVNASTVTFTNTTSNQMTNMLWEWDFGDGGSSTAKNPTYTYSNSGTYTVCLSAIGSDSLIGNCFDSACYVVQINSTGCIVSADYVYIANGLTISFTNTSAYYPYSVQWDWQFGDGNSSTDMNPTHTFSNSGTYNVCMTAWYIDGTSGYCADTVCYDITTVLDTMGYSCYIEADFNYITNGTTVYFTNTSSSYSSSVNWEWHFGDGDYSSDMHPSHTYTSPGSYNACLYAWYLDTLGDYCIDTTCYSVTVTDTASNPCNIVAEYTYTINGYIVYFTNTSSNYPYTANWEWDFDDGFHAYTMNASHGFLGGSYDVCLYASYYDNINGSCIDTMCQVITVPDTSSNFCNIKAYFTYTSNGTTAYFTNTSSNYPYSVNWEWSFGDGTYAFDMDPTHIYPSSGTYFVCLSASYNDSLNGYCADTMCMDIIVDNTTDIGQAAQNSFNLYPNPTDGITVLDLGNSGKRANVKVVNMLGEIEMNQTTNQKHLDLDLRHLKSAMYILIITDSEGKSQSLKLFRQ